MTIESALQDINNGVLDLQSADYNTFQRPLERISQAFCDEDLKPIIDDLKSKVNFDEFLENVDEGGSMMGSAQLNWPAERQHELGLVVELIERAAKDPSWFLNISHHYYYSGTKIVSGIQKITRAVFIPFNRDIRIYVEGLFSRSQAGGSVATPTVSNVTYNIGKMDNSPLQHVASGGQGQQTINFSTGDLQRAVTTYRENIETLDLDDAQRRKADAQVATIEAQLIDEPDPAIVRAAGKSLRNIVEGALAGAAGTVLATPSVWAPLLSTFS